jgi:pyruvate dehydrogenase E1 component
MPPSSELALLARKALWLSCWTIHAANHLRETGDGLKVGGHQASCASMVDLLAALYLRELRPEDRVAVKPHAGPGLPRHPVPPRRQSRRQLEAFRGWGGAQSYPEPHQGRDDVDFSTGSVGLGVAVAAFASLVQDYVRAKGWSDRPEGRMIAFVGDAELDEGNIYECLQEGWKHGLRNCWWIIDYNRQSLDGMVREGLSARIRAIFEAFGWEVITLKYCSSSAPPSPEPGGRGPARLDRRLPQPALLALTYQGGAAWRARLTDALGDQGPVSASWSAAPTRSSPRSWRTSAATASRPSPRPTPRPAATTAPRRCSPTRSRATARLSRVTRTTTRAS